MARTPQPLQRIFAANATFAAWDARRRHEAALTGLVRRQLPRALAERVRVVDARARELELAVDVGAIAAVLRQRTPDLLAVLRAEGMEFTGIRVRVQVRTTPEPKAKLLHNPIDRNALRPLAGLARDLPPGPLKAALAHFLRRAG
jgi:hypothetical protein